MSDCDKVYGKITNPETVLPLLDEFCQNLTQNKVKNAKETFEKLPKTVQCYFLKYAYNILSNKTKFTDDNFLRAFYVFKLFRGKPTRELDTYKEYLSKGETYYKYALKWWQENKTVTGVKQPGVASRARVKYDKKFQKYAEPANEIDPFYIFYTSLYTENPSSHLAITWLTEHGVYEDEKREELESLYEKLAKEKKLVK